MSEKPPETEVPTDQPIDSALTADQDSGEEVHPEPSPVEEVPEAIEEAADETVAEALAEADADADADDTTVASDLAEESQPVVYETVRFQELALPEPLLNAITKLGFEECTPIQGRALPFSL